MKRFKNILFFADGSTEVTPAFLRALALARANGARLTLFDVMEKLDTPSGRIRGLDKELSQLLLDARRSQLDALAAHDEAQALELACQVTLGHGFVEVIHAVLQQGFDLVVKAARAPQDLTQRLRGSADMHLLRKCPCPVWIDEPQAARPYRKILAAVDPLAEAGESCARLVMDLACSMARAEQAELSVVHAWQLYAESALSSGLLRTAASELNEMQRQAEALHLNAMDELLAGYGLSCADGNVHLQKGKAASVILEQSRAQQADLVVMGTVGRTGIPGFIIGNTAEDVLQQSPASVLAVKPEGFVTPLALP